MTSNLWFPFAWSDEGVGQHRFGTGSVWCTRTGSYVWLQNCFLTVPLFSPWGCAARLSLGCPQGAAVSCVFGRRCKHISRWNKEWPLSTGPSVYARVFSPHIVWTRDCATRSFSSEIMICHSQFWALSESSPPVLASNFYICGGVSELHRQHHFRKSQDRNFSGHES